MTSGDYDYEMSSLHKELDGRGAPFGYKAIFTVYRISGDDRVEWFDVSIVFSYKEVETDRQAAAFAHAEFISSMCELAEEIGSQLGPKPR